MEPNAKREASALQALDRYQNAVTEARKQLHSAIFRNIRYPSPTNKRRETGAAVLVTLAVSALLQEREYWTKRGIST